jgi:GNAT superfamily N-acetyltransferase
MRGEYGCLMLACEFKQWEKCLSLIPDNMVFDDEAHNYGKTVDPHVTVLFGFHKDKTDLKKVRGLAKSLNKPITYKIVGLSKFINPKFTVLKFDVESDELKELNSLFKDNFEYTNEHKDYHAHITISYIKKDKTDSLPEDVKFKAPYELQSSKFVYNDGDRKVYISSVLPDKPSEIIKEDEVVSVPHLGKFSYNQVLAPNKTEDLFVTDLEIHPTLRGKGLFKEFLPAMINYAHTKGFKNLILEPDITKGSANTKFLIDLYTKYGFKPYPGDESLMILPLDRR